MFKGFSQKTIDFMWGIRFNNERSWFEAHKQEYLEYLYRPMQELCHQVHGALEQECAKRGMTRRVSRIYRDARRLHGRGPYKDHLWFCMARPTQLFTSHPSLWFELEPQGWNFGLGYYVAKPVTMAKLRARMDQDPKTALGLLNKVEGQSEFLLDGPDYKRDRPAPHPRLARWYNKKSFSFIHQEPLTEDLYAPEFAKRLTEGFHFLLPLYDYLSTLDNDPSPV